MLLLLFHLSINNASRLRYHLLKHFILSHQTSNNIFMILGSFQSSERSPEAQPTYILSCDVSIDLFVLLFTEIRMLDVFVGKTSWFICSEKRIPMRRSTELCSKMLFLLLCIMLLKYFFFKERNQSNLFVNRKSYSFLLVTTHFIRWQISSFATNFVKKI